MNERMCGRKWVWLCIEILDGRINQTFRSSTIVSMLHLISTDVLYTLRSQSRFSLMKGCSI